MPYHRLFSAKRIAVSHISNELGYSVLKSRCLVASFLGILVLICYIESTEWGHHLFTRHRQNMERFTFMEASISDTSTEMILDTSTEMVDLTVCNCTCGSAAARRGPHQKVIGFSVYGDLSRVDIVQKYLLPLRETIKTIPSIYPDWIVRIYHNVIKEDDVNSSWTIFQNVLDVGSHVDLCNVTEIVNHWKMKQDLFAMTWRWLPLLDDMVDTFMSRDSDSLIVVPREQDAVREWLASDDIFHTMKDHPAHCSTSMLGGMWGVKLSEDRPRIINAFEAIFGTHHETTYGYDQSLLTDHVWPIAKTSVMAHDSYCCLNSSVSRPFPSKRGEGLLFVGGRNKPEERLRWPCPPMCRPANVTSEWIYC
ncbi:uncharacterized protein LOC130702808 [Daphnia carinata]|uniref:uncharacterized protein LOC130702808 n=1 Tax=Daphnia carinata TaxID=120202 RepID=UPI00286958BC|nr:uncharacterized protein LOC130702808 [Daphnia carinata]